MWVGNKLSRQRCERSGSCHREHRRFPMPRDPITNRVIRSIDMTGQRFGRWTVVRRAELPPNTKTRKARWVVVCDCGNKSIATREALLSGDTQSCGCLAGYVRSYQSEQAQRAREQERKANRKRQQRFLIRN